MRKQTRPPTPDILEKHGERWNQQWAELRTKNPSAQFQWYRVDGKSARQWLLPQLREMTQAHCSFCDTFPTEDRTTEPIEHFKPKSDPRFYLEAYSWDNLYYCCPKCQETKREQWDDRLLRPDAPDYKFEKYFLFDITTGEIKPNPLAKESDRDRAIATIKLYGLDSNERRRYRRLEFRKWTRSMDTDVDLWPYRDFLEGHNVAV